MQTDFIHLNRTNKVDCVLMADSKMPPLASVTRMVLDMGGDNVIDSDDNPECFDWTRTVTAAEAARQASKAKGIKAGDSKLVLSLGSAEIAAGRYTAKLIVYDPDNADGLVWGRMRLVVE